MLFLFQTHAKKVKTKLYVYSFSSRQFRLKKVTTISISAPFLFKTLDKWLKPLHFHDKGKEELSTRLENLPAFARNLFYLSFPDVQHIHPEYLIYLVPAARE